MPRKAATGESSKKRATWNDENTRKLVNILAEEKNGGCTKYDWNKIVTKLNALTNLEFGWKQVSNHHSDLKEKYKADLALQTLTGISFDPVSGCVSVEERSLERWKAFLEQHSRYGNQLVKKPLGNIELMEVLFGGQTAHGGRGFSPAMARSTADIRQGVRDLHIGDKEGSGDSESLVRTLDEEDHVSYDESKSPTKSYPSVPISVASRGKKRKSEDTVDMETKRRQANFDTVIELLQNGAGSSTGRAKASSISGALKEMKVSTVRGNKYFVAAMQYLALDMNGDIFLELENDEQKWIFLDGGVLPL